ncbi:MAG: radical SAM protein, partial [Clostridia bacterium]
MKIEKCRICPRACGALRTERAGVGWCGMGALPAVARAALHFGEEPCISGKRGSGAIFFSGCSLRCVFCQNSPISQERRGQYISIETLGGLFANLQAQGAHNINLVNPTHFVPAIRAALLAHPPGIPVVYNTSGYETPATLHSLEGLVDVYLPDLKYVDAEDARRFSGAADYPAYACEALQLMYAQTGPAQYDAEGMLLRGTLVRHLVLPGMTVGSMHVLNWLHEHLPDVPISLMGQYTPCAKACQIKGLDRPLKLREYQRVAAHLSAIGIEAGYLQPPDAAGCEAIPIWDGTGLPDDLK